MFVIDWHVIYSSFKSKSCKSESVFCFIAISDKKVLADKKILRCCWKTENLKQITGTVVCSKFLKIVQHFKRIPNNTMQFVNNKILSGNKKLVVVVYSV